jgi:hypothetical protein
VVKKISSSSSDRRCFTRRHQGFRYSALDKIQHFQFSIHHSSFIIRYSIDLSPEILFLTHVLNGDDWFRRVG